MLVPFILARATYLSLMDQVEGSGFLSPSRLPIAENLASLRDFPTVSKSLGKEQARVTKPCSQRWTWILLVGFLCKVFTTISCPGTSRPYLEPCGHEQPSPNQSLSFENNSVWIQIERSWFLFHGPIFLQRDVCFFPASPGSCCCFCCLVIELCPLCDPWTAARQASLSITNSWRLLKLMSIESVMPSNHLILCCPLLLLPSIFPRIRIFSSELALCIRWPKYWSFSFSIGPSNEYSALISFRMDWLDLLVVQGTLKSLLQNNSKTSVLWFSVFFMVQLSHPHRTTGKPGFYLIEKGEEWVMGFSVPWVLYL